MPQPGISFPTNSPLQSGSFNRNPILQNYVFASGLHKPEHSSILTTKYPQYYLTAMLDKLGASKGVAQDVWTWNVMPRTRLSGNVAADVAGGAPTGSITINSYVTNGDTYTQSAAVPPALANDYNYFIVGDTLRTAGGQILIVTGVVKNATDQVLSVSTVDGSNIAPITADSNVGHIANNFSEASNAPEGRLYLPYEDFNYTGILRRSFQISGSEFTNRTYIGDGKSWYFTVESFHQKEFARDREAFVLFGGKAVRNLTGTSVKARGIWDFVESQGILTDYTLSSSEAQFENELQNHIKNMVIEGSSTEMTVLCGANFMARVQRALRDYTLNGGVDFGKFGKQLVGLDIQGYKFMGKTIYFTHYALFDDIAILPATTASATVTDFSECSLWLDLGTDDNNEKLIKLTHKELNGASRKFIMTYETGMMNPEGASSGQVSNGKDAFTIHYLSEIGVEVKLPNRMGIMRANNA